MPNKPRINLLGQKYGRLTVIAPAEDYISPSGKHITQWKCQCDCGNTSIVSTSSLRSNGVKSCGCLRNEKAIARCTTMSKLNEKKNKYELTGEYGICYDEQKNYCYFDLEDYDKIKNVYWHIHKGYAQGYDKETRKCIFLHNIVMNYIPNGTHVIDHKNNIPYDNRKENLRLVTIQQNTYNHTLSKNNTSGFTGVYKKGKKWQSKITYNKKVIHLGTYEKKEDAINARKQAEIKYFGEYRCGGYDNAI